MPRKINSLAVAAGKLILAIQKAESEAVGGLEAAPVRDVMNRAQTLQHAAHNECVPALLNGRSVVEYLGAAWVAMHPAVESDVEIFTSALNVRAAKDKSEIEAGER